MNAGKGDSPRSCFTEKYRQNFDAINWQHKPVEIHVYINAVEHIFNKNEVSYNDVVASDGRDTNGQFTVVYINANSTKTEGHLSWSDNGTQTVQIKNGTRFGVAWTGNA